jgi:hypothetical protein
MANTVFIFDQCGQEAISYFVKDGDFSRMNGMYINACGNDENLESELLSMLYLDDGSENPETVLTDEFPVQEVSGETLVIVVGFLP